MNNKKWLTWTTVLSLIATLTVVPAIAMPMRSLSTPLAGQNIFFGWLIGMVLIVPFAIALCQNYDRINSFLGVQETTKGFLEKCVQCGRRIPIASEECPYCKSKQPS